MILRFSIKFFPNETKPDKEGKVPLRFYINVNSKRTTGTMSGVKIRPRDWDQQAQQVRKSDSNYRTHNHTLRITQSGLESKIQSAFNSGKQITKQFIKQMLNGKGDGDDFWKYTDELLIDMEKKYSAASIENYNNALGRLRGYCPSLYFSDIDPTWLRKYETRLRESGLANNTVHKHFKFLKKIFNSAIREGLIENYPFRNYDNPKYRQTDRQYLTAAEVDRIEALLRGTLTEAQRLVVHYFLLGAYSGLRQSDWIRFNHESFIRDDRIILRAKKNGELVSFIMHDKLKWIVEQLKDLPPCPSLEMTNTYLRGISKLAGLKKNVSSHTARHSFAIRCAELGISIETTAELMGITAKSCGYYYKVTNRKIDTEIQKWNQ